ncbi:MAG: hypothetical protein AB7I79_21710 [Rhizobiaceae bacterium]
MTIRFTYGVEQTFRRRWRCITIRGEIDDLRPPVVRSDCRLNGGGQIPFFVETIPDQGVDWLNGYKASPAELRCRHLGEFVIEIPTESLMPGRNALALTIDDGLGKRAAEMTFDYDPTPPALPLDLADLSAFSSIQEVGETVNGAFDLDRAANVIRSRAPVAPDALLVIGPPAQSQEATYTVRFIETRDAKWLGLSDFFAGMIEGSPPRGLRVGWCSAGMAVITPTGQARSFLAWGDHSGQPDEWAIATHPPVAFKVERGVPYSVRHRITFEDGVNSVAFRIWPKGSPEPDIWLCHERDSAVPPHLPRHEVGSFALFQHMGYPIEWSDIRIQGIDAGVEQLPRGVAGRAPFLRRERPGAF